MTKLVAFACVAAAPLVGAGIVHAGDDGGFNLTITPDQLDVGDDGFSAQYDPCTDGDLVEFTIVETNASTTATCSGGVAVASLVPRPRQARTPSSPPATKTTRRWARSPSAFRAPVPKVP